MGQEFSVNARKLAEGSQDIGELLGRCEVIASDAVQAIAAMEAAAGHAGLASSLSGAAEQGAKAFLDIGAAYQHVAGSLTAAAGTYTSVEQHLASRSEAILREMR
ncbi:MAG TPA: hypothetical protein VHO07_13700 [Streptosporangiaceae bacterium]|nr:hypothetical protein [Streptosporangiaceae bacterium]